MIALHSSSDFFCKTLFFILQQIDSEHYVVV